MDAVIMVGNSNGALNGREWAALVGEVRDLLAAHPAVAVYAEWGSPADSPLVNLAWRVEVPSMAVLRDELTRLAARYRQPSVAWLQGAIESVPV